LADNDSVWTILTSNASCLATNTATSSNVVMDITPTVVPSVVVSASNTTICAGNQVDFTATATNGGALPVYQWYKNGVLQSGNTGSFSASSLADNDSVYVVLQSNAVCPLPATATSDAIPVTVLPVAQYAFSQSICHDESYTFAGVALTTSGSYTDTLQAANGCDSIITLSLTVNPAIVTQLSQTICNGKAFNFNGQTLTASGVYNDTLASVAGCDSVVVLSLQLLQTYTDSSSAAVCQGEVYNFYGRNLTTSGVYRDTLSTVNGCDSIQVLSLTVHPLPVAVVTITGNDTLRTSGYAKYQWLLNNVKLNADTNQMLIATVNGSYSVLVTDSSGCSDTSAAVSVTGVGIAEATVLNLVVYPNPTEGRVTIQADNTGDNTLLELRDDLGRLLYTQQVTGNTLRHQLDISTYATGVYLLTVKSNGHALAVKRIFKL
ncbi:MAG TPA: T9SS type A sorting domain-containing protein, partial [Chitinophagales bacterium]|nr:T9SS type A sorting domain-containing protein [Chitinophagales bacterium]